MQQCRYWTTLWVSGTCSSDDNGAEEINKVDLASDQAVKECFCRQYEATYETKDLDLGVSEPAIFVASVRLSFVADRTLADLLDTKPLSDVELGIRVLRRAESSSPGNRAALAKRFHPFQVIVRNNLHLQELRAQTSAQSKWETEFMEALKQSQAEDATTQFQS